MGLNSHARFRSHMKVFSYQILRAGEAAGATKLIACPKPRLKCRNSRAGVTPAPHI
jgi:hypothetical protein